MKIAMAKSTKFCAVFLALAMLSIFGCSKLSQENYDKLSMGMEYQEVIELLGNPDECKSVLNAKNCIWGDSSKNITIKIVADKVVFLSSTGLN